jgi:hypothetical protein
MLLDIVDRSCEYAVQMLRSRAQVILADRLEGCPNVIAMVEAADRQSLAEAVVPVLDCIDGITEGLRLLVTQDGETSLDFLTSGDPTAHKRGQEKVNTERKTTNSKRRN